MAKKLRVGIIFGGRSGEHEVSLRSARSIIDAIDKKRYEIVPIAITKEGRWLSSGEAQKLLPESVLSNGNQPVAILGDPTRSSLTRIDTASGNLSDEKLDVVFPVLHGTFGEDGTIQGLLEMANIPYVGCGVLASATGMDKVVMKRLFREAGLPIVNFTWFLRTAWDEAPQKILNRVAQELQFPVYAKPANLGSSVGISRAENKAELKDAITEAARYDRKIIVEQGVDAREVEVSILGNDQPIASLPGEIIPGGKFYDYEEKYIKDTTQLIIPAKLSKALTTKVQQLAIRAFQAIDGSGLARVDFFIERGSNRVIVNEINTMPGFTSISMYPKLWEASGIKYSELIDRLIALALERHREKSRSIYVKL